MEEGRWERVSSRVVRDGRMLLREHVVVLPDGSTSSYDVDESNPFAVAVLAQPAPGRVLLTRQYRFPLDRWIHDLPGGAGHVGETPEQVARRECEEEVGLVPGALVHLHTYFHNPGRASWPTHLFYAADLTTGAADTSDAAEVVRRVELRVEEVDRLVEDGVVVDPALFMAWTVARRRGLVVVG